MEFNTFSSTMDIYQRDESEGTKATKLPLMAIEGNSKTLCWFPKIWQYE